MSTKTHLLIIDPQNDFCDLPESYLPPDPINADQHIRPQLPVLGSHADMQRLADLIRKSVNKITDITITLDSHHHVGIERPGIWRTKDGDPVPPFTQLSSEDVRQGKYVLQDSGTEEKVLAYLDALEKAGRYTHMIWPVHCEIGTWGHNIHADVLAACNIWERNSGRPTDKVIKGDNPYTEHYSALIAEVPDPKDARTQLNQALLDSLAASDMLLVAGEAGSHCVKATLEHYVQHVAPDLIERIVLLTDCMSPIIGFEEPYQTFLDDMAQRGAKLMTADAWLQKAQQ